LTSSRTVAALLAATVCTIAAVAAVGPAAAADGTTTTVAGTFAVGFSGDGGPATAARLDRVTDVDVGPDGDLYLADSANERVRRVDAATGTITTVAGTGVRGFNGDGRRATTADLLLPEGIAVDGHGNVFIAEHLGHRIRRVDAATGLISTVAGTGTGGYNGDGRPATTATIFRPSAVAVDPAGNLYVADTFGWRVRRVDAATGLISTAAGIGLSGDPGHDRDGPATEVLLRSPIDVEVDGRGNLHIASYEGHQVRRVDAATGLLVTLAGDGTRGSSGDGGPATAARLAHPGDVDVDGAGNVYVADTFNSRVRRIDSLTGRIGTVVGTGVPGDGGDGGPATRAQLRQPFGVTVTPAGGLLVADHAAVRHVEGAAVPPVTGPHAAQQSLVIAAHHDLLGRDPTATELTGLGRALGTGTLTRRAFVGGLASSREWVTTVVQRMYLDTLGRPGDAGGVGYWVEQIRSGHRTVAQVAASFYASPEYFDGAGGGTTAGWVDDLYRTLLGRPADATGRAYWVAQVAARGRTAVALAFFQTTESAHTRVTRLYDTLLDRRPHPADLAHWAPHVQRHGDIALATELAVSPEYLARARTRFP
jgi:sugar lactone lactonase YvrE